MSEKTRLSFFECLTESIKIFSPNSLKTISLVMLGVTIRAVKWLIQYHWGVLLMLLFPLSKDSSAIWLAQKALMPLEYFIPTAQLIDFAFQVAFIHLTVLAVRPSLESKDIFYARKHVAWVWLAILASIVLDARTEIIAGLVLIFFYDKKPYPKEAVVSLVQAAQTALYFLPLFGLIGVVNYALSSWVLYPEFWWPGFATIAWAIKIIVSYALLGVLYTTIKHKYFKTLF